MTVVLIALLGATILLNSSKTTNKTLFGVMCVLAAFWVTTNFIGANDKSDPSSTAIFIHLDFFLGVWLVFVFFLFARSFTNPTKSFLQLFDKKTIALSLLTTTISIGSISNIFVSVKKSNEGHAVLSYSDFYILYVVTLLVVALLGIAILFNKYFSSTGEKRKQLRSILIAFVVAVLFVSFANLILPNITQSTTLNQIAGNTAYLGILYFIFVIYRSIVIYKLFDIRYVVFRLITYALSIALITVLFVFVAFNLTSLLFGGQLVDFKIQVYYVITAIGVALLYNPIKEFVDKGTNRLFFQQSYSLHEALGKISSFSTRSVDAQSIQRNSLEVISETIRPEHAGFVMYDSTGKLKVSSSVASFPKTTVNTGDFLEQLAKMKQKLAIHREIDERHSHLKDYFELNHIGVIARLSTTNKTIGFLIVGHKKNGNTFSRHDLQLLALASNDLALALQNALAFEEIREFNATLQEKVNKATAALKRTNSKLIALDDTKDEFISMASHQLRTPLTSIKGYISMMLEGDLGKISPTQRKALEEAFNSSQRMVFLISDFLNVSRIRTGKFVMEKDETDLNQIVVEEITQLRELAGLRDQTINYTPPKNFPKVILDDTKTRQVMMNFIDNAIFYTPKNGKIDIVLEQTDKEIIFKVTDSGIGVPKSVQHRLFTKFFRAENARNARPDGTGLGLFMGQKIIDAQGGKMIFHSVEHEGSTFGFRFPTKTISIKPND